MASPTPIITAAIALEERKVRLGEKIDCGGGRWAFNKNLTHNIEQITVTVRSLMAEAKGDLSPFATWTNDLDSLKKQLEALDARKGACRFLLDQVGGGTHPGRALGDAGVGFRPASAQARQDVEAQVVAIEDRIGIARIVHPGQLVMVGIGAQGGA